MRGLFWVVGLSFGTVLAYTTRYYLNSDGPKYFEMSDFLRGGLWTALVNTSESPAYPFLLGVAQILMGTTVANELPLLKAVNWVAFLIAMAACDLFVTSLRSDVEALGNERGKPLPFASISAVTYSIFLYLALGWVRVRLVAPDMMVFALLLVSIWLILRIRRDPDSYAPFLVLGLAVGVAYLFKAFFFPFSVFIFTLATLVTGSVRKAIPRVLLSVAVMLLVVTPLLFALSSKVGRFSYGETGNYNYVHELAGKGDPIHRPIRLNASPQVDLFRDGPGKTYPAAQDLAYWTLGVHPYFDPSIQVKALVANAYETLGFSYGLIVLAIVWLIFHWKIGRLECGSLWPPSLFFVLIFLAIPGIGMYCLVHVEPRYLVGFFFFPFVAMTLLPRYEPSDEQTRKKAFIGVALVTLFLMEGVVETAIDQSFRGLRTAGNKISHHHVYREFLAVDAFLNQHGIQVGDETAVVGTYHVPPIYWARIAGLRITASIPDENEFISCTSEDRKQALKSLQENGIKAVVAKGTYIAPLVHEGWQLIPGTRDYYVFML